MNAEQNIRNFVIIAHIDHGKSTLADRFLELTGTVEKRKMREQYLDMMDLERERGITIKMQPVRMLWHSHRGITQNGTQNNAESSASVLAQKNADRTQNNAEFSTSVLAQKNAEEFLYGDLTYKIRGILFRVRKKIGLGHKEQVYHNALEIELKNAGLKFESKKNIPILYEGKSVGVYQPDFVVEDKILIELKSLPEIGKPQIEQLWSYLKGCDYKLALLVNFGSRDLEIKRVIYDKARTGTFQRSSASSPRVSAQVEDYILNLIDTPGHVDFTYEVSRALAAVEGAILLVDASQGIQAQTLANLHLARSQGLVIISVINKIDLPNARIEEATNELANLLDIDSKEIIQVSAKNGTNVEKILEAIIQKVPPPKIEIEKPLRALIFDSKYDPYKGVIAYVRIVDGAVQKEDKILLMAAKTESEALEIGVFKPELTICEKLESGEIGYIATGIKESGKVRVGDTITNYQLSMINDKFVPLPGYKEPKPMVFASFYPAQESDFDLLNDGLSKLKLNDAALYFEQDRSEALGRGFKCGFLGLLHMEIAAERLKREFNLEPIVTNPSVAYKIQRQDQSGQPEASSLAPNFPDKSQIEEIQEPWVKMEIVTPPQCIGSITLLLNNFRGRYLSTKTISPERLIIEAEAPLAEIIVDFYDKLKNATSGYASMSYEVLEWRPGDLIKLEILIAGEKEEAFSKIVPANKAYNIAQNLLDKLKKVVPPQLFTVALQARADGRIIAREDIKALRKDVTGYLYGGDYTRKRKLLEKQKKGKRELKKKGRVYLPAEVFLKVLKK